MANGQLWSISSRIEQVDGEEIIEPNGLLMCVALRSGPKAGNFSHRTGLSDGNRFGIDFIVPMFIGIVAARWPR